MQHRFKIGDVVSATTTATDSPVVMREAIATIDRVLGDDDRDEEVGPMYEVVVRMHVFEDELLSKEG